MRCFQVHKQRSGGDLVTKEGKTGEGIKSEADERNFQYRTNELWDGRTGGSLESRSSGFPIVSYRRASGDYSVRRNW